MKKLTFISCLLLSGDVYKRQTMLLSEAKELGANMIRLAHYPQNEYTVPLAERRWV